jgi:dTDP-4-dehydrorhamnose 3,5-epimerase
MQFDSFDIEGPRLFVPNQHRDPRGIFAETFRADEFAEALGNVKLVQENQSLSVAPNTIRGLHFQSDPCAQGKLVRVIRGAVLDVAVDIRPGSRTFGRYISLELTDQNWFQLWVPPGFAHGFRTLVANTTVVYKTSAYYSPQHDCGIAWNDPDLAIDWQLEGMEPVLSAKDSAQPSFKGWSAKAGIKSGISDRPKGNRPDHPQAQVSGPGDDENVNVIDYPGVAKKGGNWRLAGPVS